MSIPGIGCRPDISVIVPSHRAAATLGDCLDALAAQTLARNRFDVHVVDTGEDETRELVAARDEDWGGRLHHHLAVERGPGAQRNQGAAATQARYLAFTDADCMPEPGWLEAGIEAFGGGAAIVQGPTLPPDRVATPPFAHAVVLGHPTPLYESCNVMYKAEAFRAAGGFPNDLFRSVHEHFGEDCELAWTLLARGHHATFAVRARVRHAVLPADYRRHLRYQWKARFFPYLVRRVPALRRELLRNGLFLGRHSIRYDAAVAGLLAARRFPPAAILALPYMIDLRRRLPPQASPTALASHAGRHFVADSVRAAGLVWGSMRFRSLVL